MIKNKKKKNIFFSIYLWVNKKGVLLHPLTALKFIYSELVSVKKIEIHVPRHIELTAVFNRDVKDKEKESKANRN